MHIVKKDKKKLFLLLALAFVSVLLMVIGGNMDKKNDVGEAPAEVQISAENAMDAVNSDLEQLLSQVKGAGKVRVMISWSGDPEETYAYNEERSESQKEDGAMEKSEKRELVLTGGDEDPLVVSRTYPQAEGVLVVAEGGGSAAVREDLTDAVASYLDIGKNRIEITAMEGQ